MMLIKNLLKSGFFWCCFWSFVLIGCTTRNVNLSEIHVFIDEVEWVKLLPKKADELGRYTVSTGCGIAEIKFTKRVSGSKLASMTMGEWCATPHTSYPEDQLFVINSSRELLEYYMISFGDNANDNVEYIDLMDGYKKFNSEFWELLKELKEPILMGELEEGDLDFYHRYITEGVVIVRAGYMYLNKVVYIADIKDMYQLK